MKRFSLLVAILLIATIGGVYASWVYPTTTTMSTHSSKVIFLSDDSTEGVEGSYTVDSNISRFTIDPASETDYTAVLNVEYTTGNTPALKIRFTPSFNAGDDVKENCFTTYAYLDIENGMPQFEMDPDGNGPSGAATADVFNIKYNKSKYVTIVKYNETPTEGQIKWEKEGNNFVATLPITQISDLIVFNGTLSLPSIETYNALIEAFGNNQRISLRLHVTNDPAKVA